MKLEPVSAELGCYVKKSIMLFEFAPMNAKEVAINAYSTVNVLLSKGCLWMSWWENITPRTSI